LFVQSVSPIKSFRHWTNANLVKYAIWMVHSNLISPFLNEKKNSKWCFKSLLFPLFHTCDILTSKDTLANNPCEVQCQFSCFHLFRQLYYYDFWWDDCLLQWHFLCLLTSIFLRFCDELSISHYLLHSSTVFFPFLVASLFYDMLTLKVPFKVG